MPYDQFGGYTPYPQPQMNQYAFVNGIEGAKSFIVKPNQTILLMDSEQPICYMKQSNGFGQSSLRYFKLVEVQEQDLKKNENINNEDVYNLKKRVEELEKLVLSKKEE